MDGSLRWALALLLAAPGIPRADRPLPEADATEIAAPRLPGSAEGATWFYKDDHGLYVSTTGAAVEHPLGGRLALRLRALADWIGIFPPDDYADQHAHHLPGGHHHDPGGNPDAVPGGAVDAVSGASARASATGESQELRGEGGLGLLWRGRLRSRPLAVSGESRGSYEPDYQGFGAQAAAALETPESGATLSAHAGFGLDRIDPDPGDILLGETWPARQLKLTAGAAWNRPLTPRFSAGAGLSGAFLQGRLASPYRRALVATTRFPERLPADRLRLTAFAQGGYYLGYGFALHSRQGFYWDSWEAKAWIPETALAFEAHPRLLLTLRHRAYVQRPAEFYRPVYAPGERYRTGDVRLGGLEEHSGGIEAEWRATSGSGRRGPLVLTAGYALSYLEYWSLPGHDLTGHVFRLGAGLGY